MRIRTGPTQSGKPEEGDEAVKSKDMVLSRHRAYFCLEIYIYTANPMLHKTIALIAA